MMFKSIVVLCATVGMLLPSHLGQSAETEAGEIQLLPQQAAFFADQPIEWTAEILERENAILSHPLRLRWAIAYRDTVLAKGNLTLRRDEPARIRLPIDHLSQPDIPITQLTVGISINVLDGTAANAQIHSQTFPLFLINRQIPSRFSGGRAMPTLKLIDGSGELETALSSAGFPLDSRAPFLRDSKPNHRMVVLCDARRASKSLVQQAVSESNLKGFDLILFGSSEKIVLPTTDLTVARMGFSLPSLGAKIGSMVLQKAHEPALASSGFQIATEAEQLTVASAQDGAARWLVANYPRQAAINSADRGARVIVLPGSLLAHWHQSPIPRFLVFDLLNYLDLENQ